MKPKKQTNSEKPNLFEIINESDEFKYEEEGSKPEISFQGKKEDISFQKNQEDVSFQRLKEDYSFPEMNESSTQDKTRPTLSFQESSMDKTLEVSTSFVGNQKLEKRFQEVTKKSEDYRLSIEFRGRSFTMTFDKDVKTFSDLAKVFSTNFLIESKFFRFQVKTFVLT